MERTSFGKAIVVGASSGIGEQVAAQLAQSGCLVAALGRRADRLDALAARFPDLVLPYTHDVRDLPEIPALFQSITEELGGLDLIVYATGTMPPVALDEFDQDKDASMIEVNLTGAIAWLNQAALRFQGTQHGTIVGIGSLAGDRGRRGQPAYGASKAGLHTYLESLRNRLSACGVTVVTIKPGPVATEMTAHLSLKNAMTAEEAAKLILAKSARSGEHTLKVSHRLIFFVLRHIPSWIFRRLRL